MPIPVGACEVWFRYDLVGDPQSMYTHMAYTTLDVPDQGAIDAGFTAWQAAFRVLTSNQVNLTGGHVLIGSDPGTIRWDSGITAVGGTGTGENMPPNVAALARKISGLGGRRNRGRMYIPLPLEQSVSVTGQLTAAYRTAINSACAGLLIGGTIHTAFGFLQQPAILHETGSQTPTQVTDITAELYVATQRRRLRR